ncbi:MAG: histidine kinase [Gammaproteobacteria bacterium]|nr:histidine kinase [Gammaproteobacteria bacterium]
MNPDTTRAFASRLREWLYQLIYPMGTQKLLDSDSHFLPNFCESRMVINVVVVAEMLALVISLVMPVPSIFFDNYFEALLQISLFIQWIALACTGGLCAARRYLVRLPDRFALVTAYLLLLLITVIVNELTVWILYGAGKISTPRPEWYAHMHFQNLSVSAIINLLMLGYLLTKQELLKRTASEAAARIEALQSRIRPHFVFNAMNIIASLIRSDAEKAEHAVEDMSELFRMMLNNEESMVPVRREVEVAEKYLALEKLRLDNRLDVIWDIGKFPRKAIMPILTLQPLLENAITHGIERLPSGGTVSVTLWEEDDTIRIRIANPLPKARKKSTDGNMDETLDNIRQRFESHYGDQARLKTEQSEGRYIVSVVLPVRDTY